MDQPMSLTQVLNRITNWCDEQEAIAEHLDDKQDKHELLSTVHNKRINLRYYQHNLEKGEEYYFCSVCGSFELAQYIEPTRSEMLEHKWCFSCHFWKEREQLWLFRRQPCHMIMDGCFYSDGGQTPGNDTRFNGFGGHVWHYVELATGKVRRTNNLWFGGRIPKHLRETTMGDSHRQATPEEIEAFK